MRCHALRSGVLPIVVALATTVCDARSRAQDATTPRPTPVVPAAPTDPSPLDAARSSRERTREQAESALLSSLVPQAIAPAQFAALLTAIDPALHTKTEVTEAFATYRAEFERLAADPGRTIAQLLPACYTFDGARGTFVARSTPELVRLLELRDKAMRAATAAQRALFRAVELATPIDQRQTLASNKVTLLHERLGRDGLLPSTAASLNDLIPKLRLSADVRAMIAPTMLAYSEALAVLLTQRIQLLRDNEAARAAIETQSGVLWRYRLPATVDAIELRLESLDDAEFANELAIRDASIEALRRVRAQLPRAAGRQLVEEWQRTVHPELFDDERILSSLVTSVVALPELNADADRAVLDTVDAAYQRIEPLAEAACRAADQILPRLLDRTPSGISAEINARVLLLEAQKKRRSALKESLSRVRALASSAPQATLARFDDLSESILALERADRYERASLDELQTELAALQAQDLDVKPADSDATPSAPKVSPTSTPSSTPTSPSKPTSPPTTPRSGRGGRGSRNPVND